MKKNQRRKLAIMFFILAILSCISGLAVTMIRFYNEQPEYRTDLPCYDKEGNVIIGVSCKGYTGGPNLCIGGIFLTAIFGAIAYYSYPKDKDNEDH